MPILFAPPRPPQTPEGAAPINFKRTAATWILFALVAAASDLRAQYKDQREAADTELRQAEQELTLMYGLRSRDCLHEHCTKDQHVLYPDMPPHPVPVDRDVDAE